MGRKFLGISYNAPLTLTFSLACILILILNATVISGLTVALFTAPGSQTSTMPFDWTKPIHYIRLFTHVLGHANWSHLAGNLAFIVLLGPLLEERYGSLVLLLMFAMTAFVTGVLNAVFLNSALLGASGIAFMMILLASFGSVKSTGIPLTFIFALIIYLGAEISDGFVSDNIANFAHLIGGLCGSIFGFIGLSEKQKRSPQKRSAQKKVPTANQSSPPEKKISSI